MKTAGTFRRMMLLPLLLLFNHTFSQPLTDPLTGQWEGKFMGDFRTLVEITSPSPGAYEGTIRMYQGPQMIQDDALSEIRLSGLSLEFQIPAKETAFTGRLSKDSTQLSGHFVFPDGSKHPLELTRREHLAERGSPSGRCSSSAMEELGTKRFMPDEMKEDLRVLVESLRQHHPRLYAYTSEEKMGRLTDSIAFTLREPLRLEEFLLRIAPVTDAVHCSHTGLRLPGEYREWTRQCGKFLPLQVLCLPGQAWLIHAADAAASQTAPGSRIVSINDIPVEQIFGELMPLLPGEGSNTTGKWFLLSRHFSWYYHLLDPSDEFLVEWSSPPSGETEVLKAVPLQEVESRNSIHDPSAFISFRQSASGNTGILRVPSFAITDMEKYMASLDRIFGEMKEQHVRHLILDLRGNEGGHPIFAAQLLSYLVGEEFTYFKENPEASEFEPLYHPMAPNPAAFRGDLYVLVDGGCLSTTGHLLSLIRGYTRARFLGEAPGSSFRCNDYSLQVILPNSGIEANIPRITFETAVSPETGSNGFEMDVPVSPDPVDMASGVDTVMRTCMSLIREP